MRTRKRSWGDREKTQPSKQFTIRDRYPETRVRFSRPVFSIWVLHMLVVTRRAPAEPCFSNRAKRGEVSRDLMFAAEYFSGTKEPFYSIVL